MPEQQAAIPEAYRSALQAAKVLEAFLGLKGITIIQGGPSPSDPEGNIVWYVAFRDGINGFHLGIAENGQIIKAGATIGGRPCAFPIVETAR